MNRPLNLAALLAAAAVTLPALPQAARAFDCAKAESNAEKAICADPKLKAADEAMAAAYAGLLKKVSDSELWSLIIAQRKWMQEREKRAQYPNNPNLTAQLLTGTAERRRVLAGEAASGPGTGRPIKPVFVQQYRDEHQYDVNLTLIRFPTRPSRGEMLVNAETDKLVREAPMGRQSEPLDGLFAASATMTATYASPKFLSVKVESLVFTGNPRYGDARVHTLNIDLAAGRELKTGDLFPDAALATLKQDCTRQLQAQRDAQRAEMPEEVPADDQTGEDSGASGTKADNFAAWDKAVVEHLQTLRKWTFWQDKASIVIDSYEAQLEPEGLYACDFSIADLRRSLRPGAPLPE